MPRTAEELEAVEKIKAAVRLLNSGIVPLKIPDDPMLHDPFAHITDTPGLDALQAAQPYYSEEQLTAWEDKVDLEIQSDEGWARFTANAITIGGAVAEVMLNLAT